MLAWAPALLLCSGCDQGTPEIEESRGAPLRVLATYPRDGEGLDCAAADLDCGVPSGAPIELRFDRHLLHSTAVRQSIAVYSNAGGPQIALLPDYDAVERVLRYFPDQDLNPNTNYTVELTDPELTPGFGFRAFDGAPLGEGPVPTRFVFRTSASNAPPRPVCEPSCSDISTRLSGAGCARAGCHNSDAEPGACPAGQARDHNEECVGVPRMGLNLASIGELLQTAIGKVAHQAEVGPSGGIPLVNPSRMGVQMPLIDPGRPGNSYLLYKLLLRPANFTLPPDEQLTAAERARRQACTPVYMTQPADAETRVASEDERERLREWFVRGEGMPLLARGADPSRSPVTLDLLHELQRWIARGARCP